MNYTFASLNVSTYSPDTHKVVPKDAIVLDLPARDLLTLVNWLDSGRFRLGPISREFVAQVRQQTKPPRIPEPGLWGVVEDAEGSHFLREGVGGSHNWVNLDVRSSGNTRWVDIKNPVLIRPGIES